MNRRITFTVPAIAAMGLALLPSSITAQQGTLKQQLVGTWMLISCEVPANTARQPYCTNPNGSLSLDASGRYTQVLAARGRPKASTSLTDRADVKAEEYKAVAQGVIAQFGTRSIDEAGKALKTHIDGALFPNVEGTDQSVSVSLSGDEMRTVGANGTIFGWRRTR